MCYVLSHISYSCRSRFSLDVTDMPSLLELCGQPSIFMHLFSFLMVCSIIRVDPALCHSPDACDVHNIFNGVDGLCWGGDDVFKLIILRTCPMIVRPSVLLICYQRLASRFYNCPDRAEHCPGCSASGLCGFACLEAPPLTCDVPCSIWPFTRAGVVSQMSPLLMLLPTTSSERFKDDTPQWIPVIRQPLCC